MFNGKSIFISGGTGSFGRKFIARLLEQYQPKRVVVFSRDELKQYEMQQTFNAPCMRYFIGDVRDADRLRQAMRGIDYVVHAAALKQVPAAEYNPTECIRTNVNGAENIIAAAIDNGVKKSWRCPPTRRPARSTCTARPSCSRTSCSLPPTTLPASSKPGLPWCATAMWRVRAVR